MLPIPPEAQAQLDEYLTESARIMRQYTEVEKLKGFESIEIEVRKQMLEIISPKIGEFFFQRKEKNVQEINEK